MTWTNKECGQVHSEFHWVLREIETISLGKKFSEFVMPSSELGPVVTNIMISLNTWSNKKFTHYNEIRWYFKYSIFLYYVTSTHVNIQHVCNLLVSKVWTNHSELAPTSAQSTRWSLLFNCGWTLVDLIFDLTLVINFVRNRSKI
jgi:hypothetical protein